MIANRSGDYLEWYERVILLLVIFAIAYGWWQVIRWVLP